MDVEVDSSMPMGCTRRPAGSIFLDGADAADIARDGRLAITGMGRYAAPRLASERAEVVIDGNGEAQLAASRALAVRISGVGHVRYLGEPAITRDVRGIGTIEK
ncbi:GIN domain-containing protein, partial [Variovorax sp. KK3]|uniref:GIN domain-containing protein n=1 Tax=Variovorax sp. KK3 TaxID=1855728 RepID=UPI002117EB8D